MIRKVIRNFGSFVSLTRENSFACSLKYLFFQTLGIRRTFRLVLDGVPLAVRTGSPDLGVAKTCLRKEYKVLEHAFPKDVEGLIIDAGGYIGTAAIAMARMYPRATIVTIEPSSENFAVLTENIRPYANIKAINAALVPGSHPDTIELRNRGTGQWGFTIVEKPADRSAGVMEKVRTVNIERIRAEHGLRGVLILKLDIEGGEFELLGELGWLDQTDILAIELHDRIVNGCHERFFATSRNRFVFRNAGEKYISVGPSFFARLTP